MLINRQGNPLILEINHFCSFPRTQGSVSNQCEPSGVFLFKHVGYLNTDELSFKGKKNPKQQLLGQVLVCQTFQLPQHSSTAFQKNLSTVLNTADNLPHQNL